MALQTETMRPAASPRKGRRAGVVSELSVLLKVKPGREQQLREHLDNEREDTVQHVEARKILSDIQTLHARGLDLRDDQGTASTKQADRGRPATYRRLRGRGAWRAARCRDRGGAGRAGREAPQRHRDRDSLIAVLLSDRLGPQTNGSTISRYCASGLDAIRAAHGQA